MLKPYTYYTIRKDLVGILLKDMLLQWFGKYNKYFAIPTELGRKKDGCWSWRFCIDYHGLLVNVLILERIFANTIFTEFIGKESIFLPIQLSLLSSYGNCWPCVIIYTNAADSVITQIYSLIKEVDITSDYWFKVCDEDIITLSYLFLI